MSQVVIAVEKSSNSKTGTVSATYTPIYSCPNVCPFKDNGCYGQSDFCGFHLNRINLAAKEEKATTPLKIAQREAEAIRNLSGKYPLRLHVVGDCSTTMAAEVVADACHEFMSKYNQPVWSYTHAWRSIPRERWGNISILASCETLEEADWAMDRGYAVSMVRAKPFNRPFLWTTKRGQEIKMIPCLEVTKGIKCSDCKLCFNDKKLLADKRIVCFFPHGAKAELAEKAVY